MASILDLLLIEGIGGMVAVIGTEISLHDDFLKQIGIRLHPHRSNASDIHELADGLIAHEGNLHDGLSLLTRYHEVAIGIAHTTADEGGILRIEQLDVSKLHWQVVIVYQATYQLAIALADALHGYQTIAHRHLHRIITDYLADGIGNVVRIDALGNREVLQLIVDKTNLIASRSLVEVDEDIRHTAVVVIASDMLGTHR